MRLLTAVSSVRVCQGQPSKEKTNKSWSFSFAVGHPTEMNYPSNTLCCVVDARPLSLPSAMPIKESRSKGARVCQGQPLVWVYKYFAYRPIFFCFHAKIIFIEKHCDSERCFTNFLKICRVLIKC